MREIRHCQAFKNIRIREQMRISQCIAIIIPGVSAHRPATSGPSCGAASCAPIHRRSRARTATDALLSSSSALDEDDDEDANANEDDDDDDDDDDDANDDAADARRPSSPRRRAKWCSSTRRCTRQ